VDSPPSAGCEDELAVRGPPLLAPKGGGHADAVGVSFDLLLDITHVLGLNGVAYRLMVVVYRLDIICEMRDKLCATVYLHW